jgi:hypothetical protein
VKLARAVRLSGDNRSVTAGGYNERTMGDGDEIETDAELSVRERRIGIRSRHVIKYGGTKEVRPLIKEQVYDEKRLLNCMVSP